MPNQKYKVEITQIETYIVDVEAPNENEAKEWAMLKWNEIVANKTYHYHENSDPQTEITNVYDVTHTDDPFNP